MEAAGRPSSLQEVRAVFARIVGPEWMERVGDRDDLESTAALDSVSLLRAMMAIEEELEVRFDERSLGDVFSSIESISAYVDAQRATRDGG